MNDAEREEWFLAQLEKQDLDAPVLEAFLLELHRQGSGETADAWADLLLDALVTRGATGTALRFLRARTSWPSASSVAPDQWKALALRAVDQSADFKKMADHAGFDKAIPPAECFRRLLLLMDLKPGVLCYEKTWGFGIVKSTSPFYGRMEIDFEHKRAHQMSFGYAAESLQLLAEDHLLARIHRQPDAMREMAKSSPGEVVRMALRSYGPLTAVQLQETLSPRLFPAEDWKRFWEVARRELKKDPLVSLPAKRTEPLSLLATAKEYDAAWFGRLAEERDLATVLEKVDELLEEKREGLDDAAREVLANRLAFVVKGARRDQPGEVARAVMAAEILKLPAERVDVARHVESFLKPDRFLDITRALPARMVRPFLDFLLARSRDRLIELLLGLLPRLNLVTLGEAIEVLCEQGAEARCAELVRTAVAGQTVEVELLYWISRNPAKRVEWSLGSLPLIGHLILNELEKDYGGERLKAQNMLRNRYGQPEFLNELLDSMTDLQRAETVQRIRESTGWWALDRQSLLGYIVKRHAELQEILASKSADEKTTVARGPMTSHRSYRERQAQLEKLVNVDIPQNSKEIAVARSYGDLSENHEFKAAKEMQGILLRRRGELEVMLHNVRPTDFKEFAKDKAGPGTGVAFRHADGRTERFYILGEWDKDDKLGIIAYTTRMARALEGHAAGETVTIPTEHGEGECTIEEVTGLTPEVEAWMEGK